VLRGVVHLYPPLLNRDLPPLNSRSDSGLAMCDIQWSVNQAFLQNSALFRLELPDYSARGTPSKHPSIAPPLASSHQTSVNPPCPFESQPMVSMTDSCLVNGSRYPIVPSRVTRPPAPTSIPPDTILKDVILEITE